MSRRKQFKIKAQQKVRRRKRLAELKKKNLDIGDYFYDGHYLGPKKEK